MIRALLVLALLALPGLAEAAGVERASKDCAKAVHKQGRILYQFLGFNELADGSGVEMVISVRASRKLLLCAYDYASRRAKLTNYGEPPRVPSLAETADACERAVRKAGWKVEKIGRQAEVPDRFGLPSARLIRILTRHDGAKWRVDCTFDYASRRTRLTERPR